MTPFISARNQQGVTQRDAFAVPVISYHALKRDPEGQNVSGMHEYRVPHETQREIAELLSSLPRLPHF